MPLAPPFMAELMARRMARRNDTRLASLPGHALGPLSWASVSAPWTSRMFRVTCLPVILSRSARMRSASAPRWPMTTPGRAVRMSTRTRLAGALDLDPEMPAWLRFRFRYLRISMSSCRYFL